VNIKERWKEHSLYKEGKIELVPTEWVWKYWGRDVSPQADLMDGTIVTLDALWKDMLEEGLFNPLVMRVGLNTNKFRLEAGNHRIQVLHEHGIGMIPVTVEVQEDCGPHLDEVMTDATHNFEAPNGFLISEITDEYMKPSEVFKELQHVAQHNS